MIESYPFLNLTIPSDPWKQNIMLDLFTADTRNIGNYNATIEVNLVSFPLEKPLQLKQEIKILPQPPNNLPFFEPKLATSLTIQKTKSVTPWSYKLPKIEDKDQRDVVKLYADFGGANFLTLNDA